ncbi:NAD(P)-dependent dehydrogenase (short-subunit alcohol dehydrogenase family) [Arthrobacter sp. GAS37]
METLIVNAGITDDDLLLRMDEEKIRRVLETNAIGPMIAVKEALRPLLRSKDGSIVLVSSASARYGVPGQANYTAAKGALEGFARTVAKEYASKGIRCNVVAPGGTATDMTSALTEDQRQTMLNDVPLGRLARPEEIASVIYWVSQSTYMTGVTVPVTGGAVLGY